MPQGTLPELFITQGNHSEGLSCYFLLFGGALPLKPGGGGGDGAAAGETEARESLGGDSATCSGPLLQVPLQRKRPKSQIQPLVQGGMERGGGCCCLLNRAQAGTKWGCGGRKGSDSPSPAPPRPLPKGWGGMAWGAFGTMLQPLLQLNKWIFLLSPGALGPGFARSLLAPTLRCHSSWCRSVWGQSHPYGPDPQSALQCPDTGVPVLSPKSGAR